MFAKIFIAVIIACFAITNTTYGANCPDTSSYADGFTALVLVDSTIIQDIRYFTPHNFVGKPIDGYECPTCVLSNPAAEALAKVQAELKQFGLSLKVYDCYRPQRAVDHFVRWAKDLGDTITKREFYPTVDKINLFKDGYIAAKSGHTRGSTVDLTIVALPLEKQQGYKPGMKLCECTKPADQRFGDNSLDFGTGFDCFDPLTHTLSPAIDAKQRAMRGLLVSVMNKFGFINYPMEWWHFTLQNEPFPNTYFDFPVK